MTLPSAGGRRTLQDMAALKSTLYIQTIKSSTHLVLVFPFFLLSFFPSVRYPSTFLFISAVRFTNL